jgi:hypothetical protein
VKIVKVGSILKPGKRFFVRFGYWASTPTRPSLGEGFWLADIFENFFLGLPAPLTLSLQGKALGNGVPWEFYSICGQGLREKRRKLEVSPFFGSLPLESGF